MVKIFLENKTDWDSKSIKSFFKLILEHEGLIDAPIVLRTTRPRRRTLGYAYYGKVRDIDQKLYQKRGWHYSITMRLPKGQHSEETRNQLVKTMVHEIAHCRNVRHKDMPNSITYDISWFPKDLQLCPKQASLLKPRDLKQERYTSACKKLKEAESKAKRWNKLVKKYTLKVKYYEKKLINKNKS